MNTINVENCKTLLIGRRGENEVTTVAFDFSEWASEFGSGVVDLYVKRFGDDSAYPVVLTIDGTVASWLVTETDTNVAGYGKAEYVYRVDGKIAKSAVFPFFVAEDIGQPASEPPDPYESWLEQLTALGAETEAHAQAAEQSAEDAAESAEDAAQSAASAEGYAGQAETAAGLAQAAQTASEAARDAAQTAQASAESSATAASGSAASAASSATAAAGSASDASASASAAGASASAAGNAATQAEAAKTAAQNAQSAAEDAAADAQQAAQEAHVEYEQLSGEVDDLSDEVAQQKSAIEALEDLTNRKAGMLVDTASGAIASFVPDATIPDLLGVSVDIEPVQDLHGYENPWPGGGGANKFDQDTIYASYKQTDGSFVGSGAAIAAIMFFVPSALVGMQLTFSAKFKRTSGSTITDIRVEAVVNGARSLGARVNSESYTLSSVTFTPNSTDDYVRIAFGSQSGQQMQFKDVMLALGTATTYSPYSNECPISGWDSVDIWNKPTHDTTLPPTVTIQLGQTVYGGTLDVTNGTLTVDRVIAKKLWSELTSPIVYTNITRKLFVKPAEYRGNNERKTLSNIGKDNGGTSDDFVHIVTYSNGSNIYVFMPNGTADDTTIELCYLIGTPIVIQLDPVTISTISGQTNNVWADAGDVSVEFAADLKAYIDSKIAAAVAALS